MIVNRLNDSYFFFTMRDAEKADPRYALLRLKLKELIPGQRGKKNKAMRFYLAKRKWYCIHRYYFPVFAGLVKDIYGIEVKNPNLELV